MSDLRDVQTTMYISMYRQSLCPDRATYSSQPLSCQTGMVSLFFPLVSHSLSLWQIRGYLTSWFLSFCCSTVSSFTSQRCKVKSDCNRKIILARFCQDAVAMWKLPTHPDALLAVTFWQLQILFPSSCWTTILHSYASECCSIVGECQTQFISVSECFVDMISHNCKYSLFGLMMLLLTSSFHIWFVLLQQGSYQQCLFM